jgi:hypothetical protein
MAIFNKRIPTYSKIIHVFFFRYKGFCVLMKRSRGSYATAGTPHVVKEYRAQLAFELKRRGVSLDVFVKANNVIQFGMKLHTLQEHVKVIDEGAAPLSAEKKSGRPAKLTDE